MRVRTVAGFLTGLLIWWFLFLAFGIVFGLLWPDYREAARFMFSTGEFSHFTTPMLLLNYLVFLIGGVVTGWLTTLISNHRTPAMIVALLYLSYTIFDHYHLIWDKLPGWYNVIVPWVIACAIVLGSRLHRPPAIAAGR